MKEGAGGKILIIVMVNKMRSGESYERSKLVSSQRYQILAFNSI